MKTAIVTSPYELYSVTTPSLKRNENANPVPGVSS